MDNQNLTKVKLFIKKDIDNFEKCLEEIVSNQDIFLKEDLYNFIFKNPKRLRPIFTFLFANFLNIKDENNILNIALAQELIHSASLIHDDIIDEEISRRGQETFYSKYNSKTSVILGDMLLSLSLEVLAKTNIEIVKIFAQKIKKTILGELKQNENNFKTTNEKEYFEKTFAKTGNLFLAGLESLFILKNIDFAIREDLINFLTNFTIAFQLNNDLNDFSKNNSSDIKNGNYTLPMLYFLMENKIENFNNNNEIQKYTKQTEEKIKELFLKSILYLEKYKQNKNIELIIELSKYALGS